MTGALAHGGHDPDVALAGWWPAVLVAGVLVAGYLVAVGRFTRRTLRPWPAARTAAFVSGSALIALGLAPPVHALAAADPCGHVLQHLLLGMYAPVALVVAAPMTPLLAALPPRAARGLTRMLRSRPARVLTHPVTAGLVAVAGVYALYFTPLYAASVQDPLVGSGLHLHVLLTGCVLALSVAGADPAPARPGLRLRVGVLVGVAGAHAYLAKALYAGAATWPAVAGHDAEEIRQAAQLMYYGGDVAELMLAIALFAAWRAGRSGRAAQAKSLESRSMTKPSRPVSMPTGRKPTAA